MPEQAAHGDAQPAQEGEDDRTLDDEPADAARDIGGQAEDEDAREQASEQAPGHRHHRHHQPDAAERHGRGGRAEIGVVAQDRERGDAGGDDAADDEPRGLGLERARQLLDREDDAGERRVEGGGDAGGGAGQQQVLLVDHRRLAADEAHDGGRRPAPVGPSPPDRGAAEQADHHHDDLAERRLERDEGVAPLGVLDLARGDDLRDAGALGVRKHAAGEKDAECEAERRDDEREPLGATDDLGEQNLGLVGDHRHQHARRRRRRGRRAGTRRGAAIGPTARREKPQAADQGAAPGLASRQEGHRGGGVRAGDRLIRVADGAGKILLPARNVRVET